MGTLQFTRDGGHLVVVDEQAVTIVEVGRDASRRIELAGVRAVATVRDELWLVTADWLLARRGLDGRCHGNELRLPCDPTAALVPTSCGVGAVLWTAAAPIAVVEDLGSLVQIAPGADATFPLSARRWIRSSGNRVTFPSGATIEGHGRLVGVSAIWEGNAVLLVFETPRGRVGIVAHPSTARVIDRVELPLGPWQVAARRGVVAILTSPYRIELIDVRLGRPCGAITSDVAILDFAIDHDGTALATRIEGGHVELAQVAERASDKVDPPAAEPAPAVALASSAPDVPAPAPEVAAAEVAPPRSRPFALPGLEPRPRRALPDRPTARARLDPRDAHRRAVDAPGDRARLGHASDRVRERRPASLRAGACSRAALKGLHAAICGRITNWKYW